MAVKREGEKNVENLSSKADTVSSNDINTDAVLNLRTDDLNWKGKQSSSLCDRFQIHMFTEEFEQAEQDVARLEQENNATVFENIMFQEANDNSETEQIFETIMNAETETIIKADYVMKNKNGFDVSVFYIFGGIAIAGLVLWFVERRRKRK